MVEERPDGPERVVLREERRKGYGAEERELLSVLALHEPQDGPARQNAGVAQQPLSMCVDAYRKTTLRDLWTSAATLAEQSPRIADHITILKYQDCLLVQHCDAILDYLTDMLLDEGIEDGDINDFGLAVDDVIGAFAIIRCRLVDSVR